MDMSVRVARCWMLEQVPFLRSRHDYRGKRRFQFGGDAACWSTWSAQVRDSCFLAMRLCVVDLYHRLMGHAMWCFRFL